MQVALLFLGDAIAPHAMDVPPPGSAGRFLRPVARNCRMAEVHQNGLGNGIRMDCPRGASDQAPVSGSARTLGSLKEETAFREAFTTAWWRMAGSRPQIS